MIKIIKRGHARYCMMCESCDCVFTFEGSDIKNSSNPSDWIEYIECPECGRRINIVNHAIYGFKEKNV